MTPGTLEATRTFIRVDADRKPSLTPSRTTATFPTFFDRSSKKRWLRKVLYIFSLLGSPREGGVTALRLLNRPKNKGIEPSGCAASLLLEAFL